MAEGLLDGLCEVIEKTKGMQYRETSVKKKDTTNIFAAGK